MNEKLKPQEPEPISVEVGQIFKPFEQADINPNQHPKALKDDFVYSSAFRFKDMKALLNVYPHCIINMGGDEGSIISLVFEVNKLKQLDALRQYSLELNYDLTPQNDGLGKISLNCGTDPSREFVEKALEREGKATVYDQSIDSAGMKFFSVKGMQAKITEKEGLQEGTN